MNVRFLNALVLSTILSLGVFFGINVNSFDNTVAEIDASHQEYLSNEYKQTIKEITEDIIINSANNFNNSNSGKKNSGSSSSVQKEVNFKNFYEMYAFAVNKLNNASLVESHATGSMELLEGASIGTGGITLVTLTSPLKINLSFLKQKNGREKLFRMNLKGSAIGKNFDVNTTHYTAGINYEYDAPGIGGVVIPGSTYIEKFNWDMVQPFHLANEHISNKLTESEIMSWYKDNKGIYHSIIEINASAFKSNFSTILSGIFGVNVPFSYNQIILTIKVDSYGNFISIEYNDKITLNKASIMGFEINNARANLNLTETFVTIDNNFVQIKKPT